MAVACLKRTNAEPGLNGQSDVLRLKLAFVRLFTLFSPSVQILVTHCENFPSLHLPGP